MCPRNGPALAFVPHSGTQAPAGKGQGEVASAQTHRWVSEHSAGLLVSYRAPVPQSRRPLAPHGALEPQGLLLDPQSGGLGLNS